MRPEEEDEPTFSVYVEFDKADVSPESIEALFSALLGKHEAVGDSNGNLALRLTVRTDCVIQSAALGIEYTQASALHDITHNKVIDTKVLTQPGARDIWERV